MQKLRVAVSVLQLRRDGDTDHPKFACGCILDQPCSKDKSEHTEGVVGKEAHGNPPSSLRSTEGNSPSPKGVLPLLKAMMKSCCLDKWSFWGSSWRLR